MLKPLWQQATSASCHFNVLSIFSLCVCSTSHGASSPLPTAIGYEDAAKPCLEHVTWNEPGKLHTKPSDLWLREKLPPGQKERRQRRWHLHRGSTQPAGLSCGFLQDRDGVGAPSPWGAPAHFSLQTKLNSSTVTLQITGLLDHNFKALKLVLVFEVFVPLTS